MKRVGNPALSAAGRAAIVAYADHLRHQRDLSADTRRNSLSDLQQFAAWCEGSCGDGQEEG
jgi:hypothetical protein